jgi:hypothetical protein
MYEVLPEERAAICEFALRFAKIGYRKLTWMMVDAGVACVGESTVYRVLSDADLLSRWKRSVASSGEYHFRPIAPNQHPGAGGPPCGSAQTGALAVHSNPL